MSNPRRTPCLAALHVNSYPQLLFAGARRELKHQTTSDTLRQLYVEVASTLRKPPARSRALASFLALFVGLVSMVWFF